MDIAYIITPFVAWLFAGSTKFAVNSLRSGELAFSQIGYGGMPSNHSAIVSSMAMLVVLREGVQTPVFGVALTLAYIVMMDANGLRQKIAQQAKTINALKKQLNLDIPDVRERMGHTKPEIAAGILVGCLTALFVHHGLQLIM